MSYDKLHAAAAALVAKLPQPGSPSEAHYHAKPELDALRAELAKPIMLALPVRDVMPKVCPHDISLDLPCSLCATGMAQRCS